MLKKLRRIIYDWSFRKRLGIILTLFTLIPSTLLAQLMMYFYQEDIISNTSVNMYAVVEANNNVLDMKLRQVEDISSQMLNSEDYYRLFLGIEDKPVSDYMEYDRKLRIELARQFTAQKDVYSSFLYTREWLFGKKDLMNLNKEGVEESGLIQIAMDAGGQPVWVAGYDFGSRIGSDFLQHKSAYEYQYPITMVRKMDFQYNYYSDYRRLSSEGEVPVLILYLLEKDIRKTYEGSLGYEGSMYGISDQNGIVLSSDSNQFPCAQKIPEEIGQYYGSSGFSSCIFNNQKFLLCYDMVEATGWFSWALVPLQQAIQDTVNRFRMVQILSLLVCILLSAVVAGLLSKMITVPVERLIKAANRVATGIFSADTPIPRGKDFKLLTESFNHMEEEINRLIHENYEISLREKETQLMALSMQINPHFLYNTLNTINMLAIANEDEETSDLIVSLSEMLQYTLKNRSEKIPLMDEMGWISNYIYIMSRRFEDVFQTQIDIREDVLECKVPKFFLQPLVENSILHGFREMKSGGILRILASREGDSVHFQIQDNGKGMDAETIRRSITQAANDGGIGISNVHRRLVLIYGEKYRVEVQSVPGEGTLLHLYIPFEV